MTPAEVCSYLRGRLQMKVQALENGQYALSPLPRDTGGKSWDPECWDLPELCAHYGIPIWKVGLAPAPAAVPGDRDYLPPVEMGLGSSAQPCLAWAPDREVACTREKGHDQDPIQGSARDHAAHNLRGEMVRRWPALTPISSDGT